MEKFTATKEKSVFRNLFGRSSDSEASSSEDDEETTLQEVQSPSGPSISTYISSSGDVQIKMQEEKLLGIAHQLWPAAKFMCAYLEANQYIVTDFNSTSLNVIELGAGVGLCGLFISKLFHSKYSDNINIVLTDLPEAVDRLQHNVELNELQSSVSADVLSWGNEEDSNRILSRFSSPPLIIAADCVYWECLFTPLFETIQHLTGKGCEVIMSHVKRWKKDAKFFALCRKNNLTVDVLIETLEMIPNEHTGEPNKQITRVYRIKKAT